MKEDFPVRQSCTNLKPCTRVVVNGPAVKSEQNVQAGQDRERRAQTLAQLALGTARCGIALP